VIVVDASVWVSRLVHNDINHQLSRQWLDEQITATRPLYSPTLLLPEVAGPSRDKLVVPDWLSARLRTSNA
jgi:hypothetical protein